MKKSLQSKLMKYSLTAAAVVAVGANANAQVLYSGTVDANVTSSYNIDLNNDQVTDFIIKVSTSSYTFKVATTNTYKYVGLSAVSSNEWVHTYKKANGSYFVKPLSSGVFVGSTSNWFGVFNNANMGRSTNSTNFFPNSFFIGQGDKYIGVKLNISGGPFYGWIRVNVPSGTNDLTVKDWAFEQTANKLIKTGQTVAIDDISADNLNISFGPNPTSGYLKISADDNYKVQILDMTGKIITEAQMNNNTAEFDLSNLDAGIYVAKLSNDNLTKTVKIVKK